MRLAHGIASAASPLHAQGILHGDLYAHNILAIPTGQALLGDFGAASFFEVAAPEVAQQRLAGGPLAVCWKNCWPTARLVRPPRWPR